MASMVRCSGAACGPIKGTIDTMAIRSWGTAQKRRVPPPSQPKLPTGKRVPAASGMVTLRKPRPNLTPSGGRYNVPGLCECPNERGQDPDRLLRRMINIAREHPGPHVVDRLYWQSGASLREHVRLLVSVAQKARAGGVTP